MPGCLAAKWISAAGPFTSTITAIPQHDHLYCQQCHKLIEFASEEVQQIRDAVAREHNFRVAGPSADHHRHLQRMPPISPAPTRRLELV